MDEYSREIGAIQEKGCLRRIPEIEYREGKNIVLHGQIYLNLSSNDYLGLSTDTDVRDEFLERHRHEPEFLFSSASGRLLSGSSRAYDELEQTLARSFGREACLLFNTGYQCNLGVIASLAGRGDVIFSDKLNHASTVAGLQLSGAAFYRFRHGDYEHLERLLQAHRSGSRRALIISESVFSMDGDLADIDRLVELKKQYNALLMVDEAHAFGVFGEHLSGLCEGKDVDVITATLGKSLASMGAFCIADKSVIEFLTNTAPSFIFSTALPPVNILWSRFLLTDKQELLYSRRDALTSLFHGLQQPSQIIPVLIGESEEAARVASALREAHYFVLPIRPPTVPQHTARLRISLMATMSPAEITELFQCVEKLR